MKGQEFVLGRELDQGAGAVVSTSPGKRGPGQPLQAGEEVQLFPLFQEKVLFFQMWPAWLKRGFVVKHFEGICLLCFITLIRELNVPISQLFNMRPV